MVNNLIPTKVKQKENLPHKLLQCFFNIVPFSNKSNTAAVNQFNPPRQHLINQTLPLHNYPRGSF